MKKYLCILFCFFLMSISNLKAQVLIESIDLKKSGIVLTIDSIVKYYREINTENIDINIIENSIEVKIYPFRLIYKIEKNHANLYQINNSKSIDTNSINDNIKLNNGRLSPSIIQYYSISEIIYGLKNYKYFSQLESKLNDSLVSTKRNIIPNNFAYALVINTKKNIETFENGMDYYSVFTNDKKLCQECKIIDTLYEANNNLLINNLFSLNCIEPIEYSLCGFDPHDAVAYYNHKNELIAYIEICFSCGNISVLNFINNKSNYFQLRSLEVMNNLLYIHSIDTESKLSPELLKMLFNRRILDNEEKIQQLKDEYTKKQKF